jgi:hypothetical protein
MSGLYNKINGTALKGLVYAIETAHIKKCKQLFQYQHLLLLRDSGGKSFNLYLDVVHFPNTSVN